MKVRKNFRNRPRGSPLRCNSLVEIFDILGPRSHSREPIDVKFRVDKWTHVPLGLDKFHVNRCNKSPLQGENADFWPELI